MLLQFFKLDVVTSEGAVLSLNQLRSFLQLILNESSEMAPPVGILTTENRDNWYSAYKQLTKGNVGANYCQFITFLAF